MFIKQMQITIETADNKAAFSINHALIIKLCLLLK